MLGKITCIFIFCCLSVDLLASNLSISSLEVKTHANYKASEYTDTAVIINGKVQPYPIWNRQGYLGWAYKKPIILAFNIDNTNHKNLQLKLHSSKNTSANTFLPQMINVFEMKESGDYSLLNSKAFDNSLYTDKNNHWLPIDINPTGTKIHVVIYPKGRYFFLDEITIIAKQPSGVKNFKITPNHRSIKSHELLDVSNQLLKDYFKYENREINKINSPDFHVWKQNPWSFGVEELGDSDDVDVIGADFETEIFSIGFSHGGVQDAEFEIVASGINEDAYELYFGENVLAANGMSVNDVFMPMRNKSSISVEPNYPNYLYIKYDLNKLSIGRHEMLVEIRGLKMQVIKRQIITINVVSTKFKTPVLPFVNIWSYSHNSPIWNNPMYEYLGDSNVNVWVIPPSELPSVGGDAEENAVLILSLRNKLNKIRLAIDKPKILFFLSNNHNRNPLDEFSKLKNPVIYAKWLDSIVELMSGLGFIYDDWALYPIDEPKHSDVGLLSALASTIKKHDININIYANPIKTNRNSMSLEDLQILEGLVDIWQPIASFITNDNVQFFQTYNNKFWLYHNPGSPAKSASPINDYRMTAWKAWLHGAKGIGFWSFDDTKNSSAWDDFDGIRPDWAVVYEYYGGVYSSRRWESFKQGIEDFMLLSLSKNQNNVACISSGDVELKCIQAARKKLLNNLN